MDICKFWPGNGDHFAVHSTSWCKSQVESYSDQVPGHGLPGVACIVAFRFLTDNCETLGGQERTFAEKVVWQIFFRV